MIARDSWLNPQALGPGPESPGTVGRPCDSSDPSPSRPVELAKPAGPRTRIRVPRDSWSTPRALAPGPESHGTAGRTAGPRTQARIPRDHCSTQWALGHGPESPRKAGRHCGPLGMGPSHPGYWSARGHSDLGRNRPVQLVDTVGPRTQPGMARDSLLNPWALQHGPESPRRTGRSRGPSVMSAIHPGGLVEAVGPCTRARVPQDSCSTPRALGHKHECPWRGV